MIRGTGIACCLLLVVFLFPGRSIKDINKVLLELRTSPQYRSMIKDWVVPPGKEEAYWKIYEDQILNVKE